MGIGPELVPLLDPKFDVIGVVVGPLLLPDNIVDDEDPLARLIGAVVDIEL